MSLYYYSFVTWGYHFNSLISHVFFEIKANDFEEMLLHHIATNGLYFCYIFGNQIPIGCLISFIHDIADVPGHMSKFLNTTEHNSICAFAFVTCMISWLYTRILIFPQIVYYVYFGHLYPEEYAWCQWYMTLCAIFLTPLAVLHVYWFGLFIQILNHFISKGESEDLQNNVHKAVSPSSGPKTKPEK